MTAAWPKPIARLIDAEAERLFEQFKAVVTAIRNTRAELNVPLDSRPLIHLSSAQPAVRTFFEAHGSLLQVLAGTGEVKVEANRRHAKHAAAIVVDGVEMMMPLEGLIDVEKERARLQQRVDELTNQVSRLEAKLADPQFTERAPKDVVQQAKDNLTQTRKTLKVCLDHLSVLQSM